MCILCSSLAANTKFNPKIYATMPITAFMHSHVLVVILFLILFIIKAFMLFTNKIQALENLKRKTKVLDMIFGTKLNIHLKATVARLTREHIGFAYERIPPSKEKPLWDLLGGYADKLERFPH